MEVETLFTFRLPDRSGLRCRSDFLRRVLRRPDFTRPLSQVPSTPLAPTATALHRHSFPSRVGTGVREVMYPVAPLVDKGTRSQTTSLDSTHGPGPRLSLLYPSPRVPSPYPRRSTPDLRWSFLSSYTCRCVCPRVSVRVSVRVSTCVRVCQGLWVPSPLPERDVGYTGGRAVRVRPGFFPVATVPLTGGCRNTVRRLPTDTSRPYATWDPMCPTPCLQ